MKALYKKNLEAYDFELRNIDVPVPESDEVVIKVEAVGICGTDLKMYQGKYKKINYPIVIGHEFSGTVYDKGKEVKENPIGSRVTARPTLAYCGQCDMCNNGIVNLCKERERLGFEQNGAFAEFVRVRQEQIFNLPQEIDIISGAMIEPLSVVIHGIRKVNIRPSDVVHIIGPGSIGLLALLIAKANGAFVSISGLKQDKDKLTLAKKLGADLILFADDEEGYTPLINNTDGYGADIILECSGYPQGVAAGLDICKPAGKFVQIGTWSEPMNIDFMKIAYKEIEVFGSYSHTRIDWIDSIKLLQSKKIDVGPLIEVLPLDEWKKGFEKLESGEATKVILKP